MLRYIPGQFLTDKPLIYIKSNTEIFTLDN